MSENPSQSLRALPRPKHMDESGATADVAAPVPAEHEYVSFEDEDEDRTWLFDVTFLMSSWRCLWGHGCLGVLTAPAQELEQGCCSYGAHMTGDEDALRTMDAAGKLEPRYWQYWREGSRRGVLKQVGGGAQATRIVAGACIFLNRPGFEGGTGCAFHLAALAKGEDPSDLKPDVCWQLPLRREDHDSSDGHVTTVIGPWTRRNWGPGGSEFHWWCTEATEAFSGPEPVVVAYEHELVKMVGEAVFNRLRSYLENQKGLSPERCSPRW